jgi:hypothetical protein
MIALESVLVDKFAGLPYVRLVEPLTFLGLAPGTVLHVWQWFRLLELTARTLILLEFTHWKFRMFGPVEVLSLVD